MTGLSWRPGWLTLGCLSAALLFPIWLSRLPALPFQGADAKVYFAAASLDAHGGNPYDQPALAQESERLYNLPHGLHNGDPGSYTEGPYAMPPLLTRLSRTIIPWGEPAYYLLVTAALLLASFAGLEALLSGLDWDRNRWLPRMFLLVSAPFAEETLVGNSSALIFLAWSLGFLLARRSHRLFAGIVLSVCLIKVPVGAPAVAALVAFPPGDSDGLPRWESRLRIGTGFVLATAGWAVFNLAVAGMQTNIDWMSAMVRFGRALEPGAGTSAYSQSDLAGLPALLSAAMPTPVAVAVAVLAVAAVIGVVAWRQATRGSVLQPPGAMTALALAAALLVAPYIHLNDLLLEALPLLVIASASLRWPGRVALVIWAVGVPANLALAILQAQVFHFERPYAPVGFGLVLTAIAFAGVVEVARRRPASAPVEHAGPQPAPC